MDETRVFSQSNTGAGQKTAPPARSAGREEGLGTPGHVLYVYDRVSTKKAMRRRMANTKLPPQENLSGIYKKTAQLPYDMRRNLDQFYGTSKTAGGRPVSMGRVVDESSFMPPPEKKKPKTENMDASTRYFSVPGTGPHVNQKRTDSRGNAGSRNSAGSRGSAGTGQNAGGGARGPRMAASERMENDGQTRMFYAPSMDPGTGGAAVRKRKKLITDGIINLFESIEERWIRDVDIAKKQALLHKKWLEHRRGMMMAVVILLILGLCSTAIYQLLFVVRTVEVTGASLYSDAEVLGSSGIETGMNLYDFRADEVAEEITFRCPYIKSVELTREMPDTVSLVLEEDSIRYCANIFGEIVSLSPGLRVLGTLTAEEAESYILLRLPGVTEAVAGRPLVFADARNERYIRQVLDEVADSDMEGRISYMDLRDEHDIIMHCDGMYRLQFGNTVDLELKLRMARTAIADPMFPQNTPARVDLSVISEASVRADLRLDLDETP